MKFGVVVFPGSNCDDDAFHVAHHVLGQQAEFIWHQSADLAGSDVIIIPGGFSYGDYLRTGAIARFSPSCAASKNLRAPAASSSASATDSKFYSKPDFFPALCFATQLRCLPVHIRVEATDTPSTCAAQRGQVMQAPIAHNDGNYYCDPATLDALERNNQIIFRYTTPDGREESTTNPNGSIANITASAIANVTSMGLMPHPERASEMEWDCADGLIIFQSLLQWFTQHESANANSQAAQAAAPALRA